MSDQLLTLPEVADYLGVPLQTLYQWRSQGTAPRGIRCGKHIRVRRDELEAWLERHTDANPAA
jgi:excisionase family DNA binding protein